MGIEVLFLRGGFVDFFEQFEFGFLFVFILGEEVGFEVGEDNDRNDEVFICLFEVSF